MAAEGGVQVAHFVGWVVTGLAFGGNLLWNYKNRVHTNKLGDDIRRDSYQKEVWDRHRTRIEERLDELVTLVSSLPGQVLAFPTEEGVATPLDLWGFNVNLIHDGLARALAEADSSTYCHGCKWADLANGEMHGIERSWDLVLDRFGKASRARKRESQIKHLKSMNQYVLEIELAVRAEIRDNEFLYQP